MRTPDDPFAVPEIVVSLRLHLQGVGVVVRAVDHFPACCTASIWLPWGTTAAVLVTAAHRLRAHPDVVAARVMEGRGIKVTLGMGR